VQVQDGNDLTDTEIFSVIMRDLVITSATLPTAVKGEPYNQSLSGTGGSLPYAWVVSAGSLPVGITLSTGGVFAGTPSVVGNATFTVRLTDNSSFAVTKQITLSVLGTYTRPVIEPISFSVATVGATFTHTITASNYPKTFTITGLPKGLTYVATSGIITGKPSATGLFNIQVRAANVAGASATVTAPLIIKALDKNLIGTFDGLIARDATRNRGLGGFLRVTTTSTGTFTITSAAALGGVKSLANAKNTAIGNLEALAPQITATLGGQVLTLNFDANTGAVSGALGGAVISGWRSAWNTQANPAESLQGYYSMALDLKDTVDKGIVTIPQGTGFATFSVSLAGSLSLVGKTADGQAITGSISLGSQGQFGVYAPLYANQGTLHGPLSLTLDAQSLFVGNIIRGTLTWVKPATVSRSYTNSFGPLNLAAEGGYLAPASKGNVISGLPSAGIVQLKFTDGGLASSATDPDLNFTYTDLHQVQLPALTSNPGKVALSINAATGIVTGNFTLVDSAISVTRAKVPFQGQVVRQSDGSKKAVGYFLLPQIPTATANILSGGFSLKPATP